MLNLYEFLREIPTTLYPEDRLPKMNAHIIKKSIVYTFALGFLLILMAHLYGCATGTSVSSTDASRYELVYPGGQSSSSSTTYAANVSISGLDTAQESHVKVLDKSSSSSLGSWTISKGVGTVTLKVSGFKTGSYTISAWIGDDVTGATTKDFTVSSGNVDITVSITKATSTPTPTPAATPTPTPTATATPTPTPTPVVTPTVSSTSVTAGSTAALDVEPKATFSTAMDETSITTSTIQLLESGLTPVAGKVTYANKVATFTPDAVLKHASTYKMVVKSGATGVKSSTGGLLAADSTTSFTAQLATPSLQLAASTPRETAASWAAVAGATKYKLDLTAPVSAGSKSVDNITGTSTTVTGLINGVTYTGKLTAYDASGNTAVSADSSTVPPYKFTTASIDSGVQKVDLALDSNSKAHVVGVAPEGLIRYMKNTTGSWVKESGPDLDTVVGNPSITTSGGIVYIAYPDNTNSRIVVISKSTSAGVGGWTTDVAESSFSNSSTTRTDIQVANGKIFVLYRESSVVKLATKAVGGNWHAGCA